MKLRKLLPLLLAVTLIGCVPTPALTVSPPTVQQFTGTAAPASNTSPAAAGNATQAPSPSSVPATITAARPTSRPSTATPTALVIPIGTLTELATIPPADTPTSAPTDIRGPVWGHQTKFSGCLALGALPDPACTPGDIFSAVTKGQVCIPGYSSSVRDVPASEKDQVYAEYGIVSHSTGQYEVDHFVSLELGGSNDISNLWPEPANPTPGFHQKDQVENYLHDQVCQHGTMTLTEAQQEIATNWLTVYGTLPGAGNTTPQPTPAQSTIQPPQATAPQSSPTAQPPQATAAASDFTLTQLTSPVGRGGNASATIQTAAGAACSIGYVTPAGNQSTAQGLVSETSNGSGVCDWTWKISPTTKTGTGTVTIMANGSTQSFPIVIQ